MPPIGGRMNGRCPLVPGDWWLGVGATDALDRLVAIRMSVELEHQPAAVAVAQLLGDHPWLQLELVEHVAGAEVPQLVEIELVLDISGDAFAEVVCRWQARGERSPYGVPGAPLAFLAELAAALGAKDQIVAQPSRLGQNGASRWLGDVEAAGAAVLGLGFTAQRGVELAAQV